METELITNDGVVLTSVGVDHEDSIGHDTNEIIQRQSVLNQQQQRQRLGTELTLPQKVKLIQKASRQQTSNSKLARQFGISPATVGRILKRKEEYLNLAKGDFSGGRKRKFRVDANVLLNQKVLHWIESLQTQDMLITNQMIRNKALQIAKELEINKFKASNGWLESFRQRHQIRVARASSKAHGNVPGAVDIAMNNNVNLGLRFEEECSHTDDHMLDEIVEVDSLQQPSALSSLYDCVLVSTTSDQTQTPLIGKLLRLVQDQSQMIQQLQRQLRDQEEKQQDFRIEVRGLFSKIKSTGSSFPSAAHDG